MARSTAAIFIFVLIYLFKLGLARIVLYHHNTRLKKLHGKVNPAQTCRAKLSLVFNFRTLKSSLQTDKAQDQFDVATELSLQLGC